jgi:hypothetical protein
MFKSIIHSIFTLKVLSTMSSSLHLLAELPPLQIPLLLPLLRLLQILVQARLPQLPHLPLRLLGQRKLPASHRMAMVEVKV